MKKYGLSLLAIVLIFIISNLCFAQSPADIEKFPSCAMCGMDRQQFAQSRMYAAYADGSTVGTCSIHCMAKALALNTGKTPQTIEVANYNTKNLIDAKKAVWVIGGKIPGVMTATPKWAFENKFDAEAFIHANGGNLATFDDALKASNDEMKPVKLNLE
jgi:copper chaperone NosL